MNKSLSFAWLDYITIKYYLKNIFIFLIVFALISFLTGETSTFIGILMMYGTIYVSYPFAVGDKNGIDTLYATLPLSKKNIVIGRYVFALSLNVIMGVISLAVSAILMNVLGKAFNFGETLIVVLACFLLFSILEAAQLPIYFKLGYVKAKFLAFLPLAAFLAAVLAVSAFVGKEKVVPLVDSILSWVQANNVYTAISIVIIWAFIMLFSLWLSIRFYKKREF